jgi:hypothetical protein
MSFSFFVRSAVTCWCLAIASPAVVLGQTNFGPQGVEFPIAGSLPGDQVLSAAAIAPAGGYLVWQDNAVTSKGRRIRAEQLGSTLALAGTNCFVVSSIANSAVAGDQEKPQVALLQGGGAVIVWQGGRAGSQQIYARFLKSTGAFLTRDIRVNARPKNAQRDAQVATLSNGNVVIVWCSDGEDGSMLGVFGRCFTPAGKPLGPEFRVNDWTRYNQRNPAVAALANGNFVVSWVSELQRSFSSIDVYARIFSPAGVAATAEIPINLSTSNTCANPSLAASPSGGFAVAWSQNANVVQSVASGSTLILSTSLVTTAPSTNSWDVYASLCDDAGNVTLPAVRVNTFTYGDQFAPKLAALGNGYIAVWTSNGQVGRLDAVFGQFLNTDGSFDGAEFRVGSGSGYRQMQPAVASDGASRFLVVWSSYAGGPASFDLAAQVYKSLIP